MKTIWTEKTIELIFKTAVNNVKKKHNITGKTLFLPLRAALTGRVNGIDLKKVLILLGKEETLKRLKKCEKETGGELKCRQRQENCLIR